MHVYKIERKLYGYRLTFAEFIDADEMSRWLAESTEALQGQGPEFGVFVDMRTLKPLPKSAQAAMEKGQKLYKQKGMARSAVILNDALTTMQFQRIAKATGIYEWERYVDSSITPDWEKVGLDWITSASDPDAVREKAGAGR